jgi:hypothetical protein
MGDIGRNLLHNPLFNVSQRGVGPWTASGNYTADRWRIVSGAGGSRSASLPALNDAVRAVIGDEAATLCLQNIIAGGAGANDYDVILQAVEGVRRLSGKTVTLSFWANTSGTPKLGISFSQSFGTGGSPSAAATVQTTALTLANVWVRYSVTTTLPSTAGKTFGTNGDDQTSIYFWLSSGTNPIGPPTNPGVQTATFQFWGVQLEIGSVATPLEKPDPRYDLANCHRFYQPVSVTIRTAASAGSQVFGHTVSWLPMRVIPTTTLISTAASSNMSSPALTAYVGNGGFYSVTSVAAGDVYVFNSMYGLSADL